MKVRVKTATAEREFTTAAEAVGALVFAGRPAAKITLVAGSDWTSPGDILSTIGGLLAEGYTPAVFASEYTVPYSFDHPDKNRNEDYTEKRARLRQALGIFRAALDLSEPQPETEDDDETEAA